MKFQEVRLSNGRSFNFHTSVVTIENPLGIVRAMLKEYTLTEEAQSQQSAVYKLHKTKDGYWYDHPFMEKPAAHLMMQLKSAIDKVEENK